MSAREDLPALTFASPAAWETWLAERHATAPGVWLKLAKKATGIESITYAEALDVALCYGWIDSQKRSFDAAYWLQRFTPRKPKSKWSKINRQRATELIDAGRMKPAGLREVELARADGRWEAAYDAQSTATVPEDLARALDQNEAARAFFAALDRANRYAILYRVQEARKPETRARRIATYVAMLGEGRTLYPRPGSGRANPE